MMSRHSGIGMTSQRTRERLVGRLADKGINNLTVLDVIRRTPRHIFVDEALASRAYEDTALPIGFGQTISQPWVVARMTEVLLEHVGPNSKILEVGTGSGYQAAVLGQIFDEVWTVERINELLRLARRRIRELHINNVRFRHADGHMGWQPEAPYDGIILTAAPLEIPHELLDQLKVGGWLIAPVGDRHHQDLILVQRTPTGFEQETLEPVIFVPLQGGIG